MAEGMVNDPAGSSIERLKEIVAEKEKVKVQAESAVAKLKEVIAEMETEEGLEHLRSGDLKFEIKLEAGALWYVAYGTA